MRTRETTIKGFAAAALSATLAACGGGGDAPTINSFTATPLTVNAGERAELAWDVSDADKVTLTNVRTGMVIAESAEATGTVMTGILNETTGFSLTASSDEGDVARSLTVMVVAVGAPTIDTFTATPMTVDQGSSSQLEWTTTDAVEVDLRAGTTTLLEAGDADGSFTVTPDDTTVYTLIARGDDGQTSMAMVTVQVSVTNPAPSVRSFDASPNPIDFGQSTTLSWDVVDADAIVVTDGDGVEIFNGTDAMGSVTVSPETQTVYTLVATNAQGDDDATVTVNVNPPQGAAVDDFSANPSTIMLGQVSTLTWAVSNADRVEITFAGGTVVDTTALTGTATVSPTDTTEYTLTAYNPNGDAMGNTTVTVNATAPIVSDFSATPNPVAIGGTTTLMWNVLGADTVTVRRGATVEASGMMGMGQVQVPITATSTTFTLEAVNATGSNTAMVTVYGHAAPVIDAFDATPDVITGTTSVTLSWAVRNVATVELFSGGVAVPGFPGVTTSTGTVDSVGTFDVTVTQATAFRLVATSLAGSVEATANVAAQTAEIEPNDDLANATTVPAAGAPMAGEINPAGEEDWYEVTVPQGGFVRAFTDDGSGACPFDTTLALTSTNGTELVFDDDGGEGTCSFIDPAVDAAAANLDAGTYYLRVRAFSASTTGSYVLNVEVGSPSCGNQVREGTEQCDDGNTVAGDGCNASCGYEAVATYSAPGAEQVVAGNLAADPQVDAIQITVTSTSYLFAQTFTSTAPVGCTDDTRLRLFASDGITELGTDDSDGISSCSAIDPNVDGFALVGPGQYWLTVEEDGRNSTVGAYFVGLLGTAPNACGNFVLEGSEQCDDGNTTGGDGCDAQCNIEAVGVYTAPSMAQTFSMQDLLVGEQDTYQINVTQETYVRVETFEDAAAGTCANPDTEIFLFDAQGTLLGSDDQGGVDSCSRIDPRVDGFARLAAGSYFLVVEDWNRDDAIPRYDIVFDSVPVDVCGNGVTEAAVGETCDDGNTVAGDGCDAQCIIEAAPAYTAPGAPQVYVNQSVAAGQAGVFPVTVTQTSYLSAQTFSDAATQSCSDDTVMRLLDGTGTELGSDDDGGVGVCSFIDPAVDGFARLAPGNYTVEVVGFGGRALPSYDLVLEGVQADVCGNGVLEAGLGEVCDDGNLVAGDGCDAMCQFEGNIVTEVEPNDAQGTATDSTLVALGTVSVTGVIAAGGDSDFWSFTVPAGGASVTARTYGQAGDPSNCNGIDTEIWLYDATGAELATNDDIGFPVYCSLIDPTMDTGAMNLAPGTYFVRVEYFSTSGSPSDFSYFMDITLQ